MGFGMYLIAIGCPPLYFAMRKRWIAACLHTIICITALPMLFLFGLGLLFWFVSAGHACWDLGMELRNDAIQKQAEAIANKMNAKQSDR